MKNMKKKYYENLKKLIQILNNLNIYYVEINNKLI